MPRHPPWLSGLVSTLQGARQLQATTIYCGGRLCVILVDTVFETACHVYLRHVARWHPTKRAEVSGSNKRKQLLAAVKEHSTSMDRTVPDHVWQLVDECHDVRNRLAHESPNEDVPTEHVNEYLDAALKFLNILFFIQLDDAINLLHLSHIVPARPGAATSANAEDTHSLLLAGQECYSGDYDRAIERVLGLLERADTPAARYLLAVCYKAKGRKHWADALTQLERAAAAMPQDSVVQLELADLLGRNNRPVDSLATLQNLQFSALDGLQRFQFHTLTARALRGVCRFKEALASLREAHTLAAHYTGSPATSDALVEVLLNLKGYDETASLLEEQIRKTPRYAYAYVCRARLQAAQGEYAAAMADLDTAWEISTAKGGRGDNRVQFTRALLALQDFESNGDSGQLTAAERILREAIPSVPAGYRPRFRNLLVHVHWCQERWKDAYQEACQSVEGNNFEERNFQYKAYASLGVDKWADAKCAAERGLLLAGQLVLPRLLCGAAVTIAAVFAETPASEIAASHSRWLSELAAAPEFRPDEFKWGPIRSRIEALLSSPRLSSNFGKPVVEDVMRRLTSAA